MKIIFDKMSIINPYKKIAKTQEFKKGVNFIVSNNNGKGNYVGKSTLLKAIFHCLGADALFDKSQNWESEGEYIYILNFTLDDRKLKMYRFGRTFYLFENEKCLFKTNERRQLAIFYSELFGYKVILKNSEEKKYIQAQPFAYFVFNFIDQTQYNGCGFSSFKNMSEFSDIYGDLIYSHLGIDNNKLALLNDEINAYQNELKLKQKELELTKNMLSKLNDNPATESILEDFETLKKELEINKLQYSNILDNYYKVKNVLYDLNNCKCMIEQNLKSLKFHLEKREPEDLKILSNHICPLCSNEIINFNEVYFKRSKGIDDINYQYICLENELVEIDKKLNKEIIKYKNLENEVKLFEEKIFVNNKNAEEFLTCLGLRKYRDEILLEYTNLNQRIDFLDKEIKNKTNECAQLKRKVSMLNDTYSDYFKITLAKYGIEIINSNLDFKLTKKISCSDPHVLSVVWLLVLNHVKYKKNKNGLFMPLVIDNPTDRDFDDQNTKIIFDMIYDSREEFDQIFVSKVKYTFDYENVNIIEIKNAKFSLLNVSDYEKCKGELDFFSSKMDTDF